MFLLLQLMILFFFEHCYMLFLFLFFFGGVLLLLSLSLMLLRCDSDGTERLKLKMAVHLLSSLDWSRDLIADIFCYRPPDMFVVYFVSFFILPIYNIFFFVFIIYHCRFIHGMAMLRLEFSTLFFRFSFLYCHSVFIFNVSA